MIDDRGPTVVNIDGSSLVIGAGAAPELVAIIVDAVRRDRGRDSPTIQRIIYGLTELAESVAESGRPLDDRADPWRTTGEVAAITGTPERTVRRRAREVDAGRSRVYRAARKDGGTWRIKL